MFAEKQTAIEQYIKDNFTEVELVFENTPAPKPEVVTQWVRLSMQFGDSFRATLGENPIYRHPGILVFQIFTEKGTGISRGVALADQLAALVRDTTVSGVNFYTPSIAKVAVNEADWHQTNVFVPFYFDEVT